MTRSRRSDGEGVAAPELPQHVSANGQEIWDWAIQLGSWQQQQDEMRRIKADLHAITRECGNCAHWMISSRCPREFRAGGRRSGPSMRAWPCSKFALSHQDEKRKGELEARLLAVGTTPPAALPDHLEERG